MYKFVLLLLLLISFEMTIAMPNLPFLDGRGVDPASVLIVAGNVSQEEEETATVVN
ncbi:hypothetical protein J3Q64DRAFT_1849120 [Phycomyces blakesleeanus]|uniref:Uncharacterized protein n=1 Tax=Phycomyces blakesleeanus TaxID=4837 RepID=A0ABR3B0R6_PHYBL